MDIKKLVRLSFLCLVVFAFVVPAQATKVKFVTFSVGAGAASGTSGHIKLTVGQAAIGKTARAPESTALGLGIWEILHVPDEALGGQDGIPNFSDHLFSNFPNPFNPSTRISFSLEQESDVLLEVYDLKGRKVDTLVQGTKGAGNHTFTYQPKNLASGVYLVLMRAGSYRASQRMMLIK